MKYNLLGQTELEVSRLCLGSMTMGWTANKQASFAVMDYAVEQGINFIDTADIYSFWAEGNDGGVAETWIGEWLTSRKMVSKIIVATKARGKMWEGPDGEGLSRTHLIRAVEDSLRRLQVDRIDLYQSHWPDENTPLEETFRAFETMIAQGKVRYVGCSNHSADQLQQALDTATQLGTPRYETLQPHYNCVHRREYEADLMGLCAREQLGVIPYSPLAGGFLTGKYKHHEQAPANSRGYGNDRMRPYTNDKGFTIVEQLAQLGKAHQASAAQMAVAWLLANPTISSVIVGANRVEQLADTIKSVDIDLSAEEKTHLDELPNPR